MGNQAPALVHQPVSKDVDEDTGRKVEDACSCGDTSSVREYILNKGGFPMNKSKRARDDGKTPKRAQGKDSSEEPSKHRMAEDKKSDEKETNGV